MGLSRISKVGWSLVVVLALSAVESRAQSSLERFNRQLELIRDEELTLAPREVPAGQRLQYDYGGYFIFDYLSIDDSNDENHVLRQSQLYLYGRVNIDGAHEFFIRTRAGWQDFNEGDSFSGRGSEAIDPDLDRAYYKFNLSRHQSAYYGKQPGDSNVIVEVGRDLVYWGNGLTLSQTIYGGMVTLSKGPAQLDLIGGITPTRTVDFDSSRPDFDFHTNRGFYGAMLSAQAGVHRPYVYGLIQQDYNPNETLDIPPTTTQFEYNSWYIGVGSNGGITDRLMYGVEAVLEGGNGLSNSFEVAPPFLVAVPQEEDKIMAWAIDGRLDYLVGDLYRTRYSAEVLFASGDPDRATSTTNTFGGNAPGTTDKAFNGFGLIYTGLAFAPSVSNLAMGRVGASTFPWAQTEKLSRLQVGADFFVYGKVRPGAPIDEASTDESFLGVEPDVFVNWQILSDVTLALRYGVFFPNADAFGDSEPRQFLSIGVTLGF
jgi:hypothetical protein